MEISAHNPSKSCSICDERLEDNRAGNGRTVKVVATPCYHLFHRTCLRNWFKNIKDLCKCPSCKRGIYWRDVTALGNQTPANDSRISKKVFQGTDFSVKSLVAERKYRKAEELLQKKREIEILKLERMKVRREKAIQQKQIILEAKLSEVANGRLGACNYFVIVIVCIGLLAVLNICFYLANPLVEPYGSPRFEIGEIKWELIPQRFEDWNDQLMYYRQNLIYVEHTASNQYIVDTVDAILEDENYISNIEIAIFEHGKRHPQPVEFIKEASKLFNMMKAAKHSGFARKTLYAYFRQNRDWQLQKFSSQGEGSLKSGTDLTISILQAPMLIKVFTIADNII